MVDFWFSRHFHFQRATLAITIRGRFSSESPACLNFFLEKSFDILDTVILPFCLLLENQESESEKFGYFVVGMSFEFSTRKLQNSHCSDLALLLLVVGNQESESKSRDIFIVWIFHQKVAKFSLP